MEKTDSSIKKPNTLSIVTCEAILSGITLGITWLCKEVAVLFIPLIFIPLLFKRSRNKITVKLIAICLSIFTVLLGSWFFYASYYAHNTSVFLGAVSPQSTVGQMRMQVSYAEFILNYFFIEAPVNFINYIKIFLKPNFALWLPMLIGFIFCIFMYFKNRSRNLLYVILPILFYLPIPIYQGKIGERLGQGHIFFTLLYICLAHSLTLLPPFRVWKVSFLKIVVLFFIGLQLVNPLGSPRKSTLGHWMFSESHLEITKYIYSVLGTTRIADLIQKFPVPQKQRDKALQYLTKPQFGFHPSERFDLQIKRAVDWLSKNKGDIPSIYCSSVIDMSIKFYSAFKYDCFSFPAHDPNSKVFSAMDSKTKDDVLNGNIVGLISYHQIQNRNIERFHFFFIIRDTDLMNYLNQENPEYFILFKSSGQYERYASFEEFYFKSKDNAEVIYENPKVIILQKKGPIHAFQSPSKFFYINKSFIEDLQWLRKNVPESFIAYEDALRKLLPSLANSPEKAKILKALDS